MTKKALVFDGSTRIYQVEDDALFRNSGAAAWVDVPDECTTDWTWDGETASPPPAPTLEEVKAAKLGALKAERDAFASGGVVYNSNTYDSDDRSQKLLAAVVAGIGAGIPLPEGFYWTTADDQDIPHTAQSIVELGAAMIMLGNTAHHRYRVAKEAVNDAATTAEVAAVTF